MLKKAIKLFAIGALALLFATAIKSVIKPRQRVYNDMPRELSVHVRRFQALAYGGRTYGTGFNMKFKGKYYVITNQHVCAVSDSLKQSGIAVVNGKVLKIIAISKKHDLCALESDRKDGLELANQDVSPLDKIYLMGHPRGIDLVIREGRIIQEDKRICVGYRDNVVKCRPSDQISATAYGGNSGSPVINKYGRVVGVLYAGSPAYPHEPFVVPYEYLKEFLNGLLQKGL